MKNRYFVRVVVLVLLAVILLAGCAARAVGQGEGNLPGRSEYPPADNDGALAGIGSLQQTAFQRGGQAADNFRNNTPRMQRVSGEVRGVWLSFLEFDHMLRGKTEAEFTANIREVYDNIAAYGLNTVIVQVRPFGDALYPSAYFPWSQFASGTEGINPGFDPLAIMVDEAHARGFRFEAWINPYRIRNSGSTIPLSADNPALRWINEGHPGVIRYNGLISYNPADPQARALIVNGVREIVRNYSVDAIHIDDYFYPTTSPGFDAASFGAYRDGGSTRTLDDWRRNNVETLMREMHAAIKAIDPNVLFGISPQSRIDYNFENLYLDIARITQNPGYTDYIMPQIYFGFEHATQPFQRSLDDWAEIVNSDYVRLYIGLAAYKSGLDDQWAGAGRSEWIDNTNLLARKVEASRGAEGYAGFVIFRYDSLFTPGASVADHVEREHQNLLALLWATDNPSA